MTSCKILHWVEYLLEAELPCVAAAFKVSGVPPSQFCQLWFGQCFLNFLDFKEILIFITGSVTMGADFQVYVAVSLFKHAREKILGQSQNGDLLQFMRHGPFEGYSFTGSVEVLQHLRGKYRHLISTDL